MPLLWLPFGPGKRMKGFREWIFVLHRTQHKFRRDSASIEAAAIAYYTLFSLFPLLLLIAAVSSYFRPTAEAWQDVSGFLRGYLPVSAELLEQTIQQVIQRRGTIGMVAILGFLWSASGVFSVIHRAINKAWAITRPRPLWLEKGLSLAMVLALSLLLPASTILATVLRMLRRLGGPLVESLGAGETLWGLLTNLGSYATIILAFLLIYRFLPYAPVRWRDVWLGAVVAGVAWQKAKDLFAWYITNFATFNLVYGSLAVIIAVLMWAYITGIILLLGAEFTAAYAEQGSRRVDNATWQDFLQGARAYFLSYWPLSWLYARRQR